MGPARGNAGCYGGMNAKRFDSFVLCDMPSLNTERNVDG